MKSKRERIEREREALRINFLHPNFYFLLLMLLLLNEIKFPLDWVNVGCETARKVMRALQEDEMKEVNWLLFYIINEQFLLSLTSDDETWKMLKTDYFLNYLPKCFMKLKK